jgi:hypothetical protein
LETLGLVLRGAWAGHSLLHSLLYIEAWSSFTQLLLQDSIRQQDWKIERIAWDNRALELQNTELRSQLQEVKTENLEVSEKIILLDEEVSMLVMLETRSTLPKCQAR